MTLTCVTKDIIILLPDVVPVFLTVPNVLTELPVLPPNVLLDMLTTLLPTFVTNAQPTVPLVIPVLPVPLLNVLPDISKITPPEVVLLVDLTVTLVLMPPPVPPVKMDISHLLVPVLNVPLTVKLVPLPENVLLLVVMLLSSS